MSKLAIICSQFPEMHETFVIREMIALHEGGIPLRIYSLKHCRDKIRHPEVQKLDSTIHYAAWDDPQTWIKSCAGFLGHPLSSLKTLGWILRHHSARPSLLLKSLVVWKQCLAMLADFKRSGISHVHAHWATMPTTAAVVMSKLLNISYSFTAHAWDIFVDNPTLMEKVKHAELVITCTDYNRRYLQNKCPDRKHRIVLNYHGVDLSKFGMAHDTGERVDTPAQWTIGEPAEKEDVPLFLSVGRLVEQKGFEDLIQAAKILHDKGIEFRSVIVGTGPLYDKFQQAIKTSGLESVVSILPGMGQKDLRKLYAAAEAFVLPCVIAKNNDRDGIPNVIFEAMAMGIPVISTNVSGVPEAVIDQRTGFCVNPHDPRQLAKSMEFVLNSPEMARELGRAGRHHIEEHFDDKVHMKQLIQMMQRLLEEGKKELPV